MNTKKLETLEDYNKKHPPNTLHLPGTYIGSGIECPKCGAELLEKTGVLCCSLPPKKTLRCNNCNYTTYVIA
jgi:hypothetical protein